MKSIIISAGHGNGDGGAVSAGGLKESDLAQRLRNKVAAHLRADGLTVMTDGAEGENKSLRDAIALLNRYPEAVAAEIHFNAGPVTARGVEVLSKAKHKPLAQSLAQSIARITGSPLRGLLGWKADNSGQHHRLGFCEAGGCVIEAEFLSNPAALSNYLFLENEVAASLANALGAAAKGE